MTAETLVLRGGPYDGKLITTKNPPPHDYRIPIAPDMAAWLIQDYDPTRDMPHIGVYKPRLGQLGHISRNDSGQLVYLWQGIR